GVSGGQLKRSRGCPSVYHWADGFSSSQSRPEIQTTFLKVVLWSENSLSLFSSVKVCVSCSAFVCPTEVIAFSEHGDEFRVIEPEVVACSTDPVHTADFRKQGGLGLMKIPLLSDITIQIAKDYRVYMEDLGHTQVGGVFIIDSVGVLRHVTLNDLPVGHSVDETLRLVQALKHNYTQWCSTFWGPVPNTNRGMFYPITEKPVGQSRSCE
uniref:thioredoxin-dependent peroxiredoxin n=1 Tax=Oncorhynchus tshawytscha TaxID=74940 RepID=A0AAZ3P2I8_ONCTS